ncbi:MAG: 50S ribosome-binding GTPase [Phascolarctobacterium sp.]|nr:50S ribosome-binding GTPase [Phascolarctobacterium sp.]
MALKDSFLQVLKNVRNNTKAYTCIAVVGQPGAGKSSLINNLIGEKVAETGPQTDVTKLISAYEYNFMRLLDVPGYGTKLFPFEKWIQDYPLEDYDAIIYVYASKLIEEDSKLFEHIRIWNQYRRKPLFLVRNHCNDLENENERLDVEKDLKKSLSYSGVVSNDVIFVDCSREKVGITELKLKIEQANIVNIWKQRISDSFEKARDVYLEEKSLLAMGEIDTYKKLAGANGLNPILVADMAIDVGIYLKMFADIRKCYGIEQNDFNLYVVFPVAKKLAELLTKQGVILLIKNFGTRFMVKNTSKYIPVIGQAVAATISWNLAKYAGEQYNNDCIELAKDVMNDLIHKEIMKI